MPPADRVRRFPAERLKQLLAARSFDAAAWNDALASQAHIRIANGPPIAGKQDVMAALAAFTEAVHLCSGEFLEMWQQRETIFIETEFSGRRHSHGDQRFPCVIIVRTTFGLIQDMRFHLDPAITVDAREGRNPGAVWQAGTRA
ncbi:MAG: hypothetical protein SFV20_13300 [Sphingopyxis sp.]|nr:hypothetical protein [Sphingopyxis sp.]